MSTNTNDTYTCGSVTCMNTNVTGQNLIASIIIDVILGVLCYIGFVLWRGYFTVYRGRELLPGVRNRPKKLSLKGHRRFWTWLIPTFKVTDAEFLASAGLDALVSVRILSYGALLFIPIGILGVGVVLPVNYTAGGLQESGQVGMDTSSSNLTYVFLRMTISNIPNGSSLMWVHFVVLAVLVFYGCLLIILYYEENISMQHTLFARYVANARNSSGNFGYTGDGEPDPLENQDKAGREDPESMAENAESEPQEDDIKSDGLLSSFEDPTHERIQRMMDPRNESLLAKAFRETVKHGEPNKLWPVRRPEPYTASKPQYAGRYAVLVIDEPRKQFAKSSVVRLSLSKGNKKGKEQSTFSLFWNLLQNLLKPSRRQTTDTASAAGDDSSVAELQDEVLTSSVTLGNVSEVRQRRLDSTCCGLFKETEAKIQNEIDDREERFAFIEATFKRLYGDDFDRLVPIYNTEVLDAKISQWYGIQAQIERMNLLLSNIKKQNPEKSEKRIKKIEEKLSKLEEKNEAMKILVEEEKENILSKAPRPTFIAVFHSAMAANSASNINANPISWRGFHTRPAPDPENLNFPALSRSWGGRAMRRIVALFFIILVMIFPLGIFTGAFSQLESAICGAPESASASASGSWICSDDMWAKLIMGIITGVIPQILMTVYQSVFLPIYVMFCAQAEGTHVSLSQLDLRCAQLFFHWSVWNFFFGTLLGGTIVNGLRQAIAEPGKIFDILGTAIPASSNFFINYVILRALTMTMFRLFYPHACVGMNIAQWFRVMPRPKTVMDFARANPVRNCRYSRDLSISVLTMFVACCTYSIISPFILAFTMIYFLLMFTVWRYQQLYVYQAAYNSMGQMWRFYAYRLLACFALTVLFTGVMLLIKRAYVQAGIAIIGGELVLLAFQKYLKERYDSIYDEAPVALLESIPRASLDPELFVPPPLRTNMDGWFLEWGKAWQFWGAPRYGY